MTRNNNDSRSNPPPLPRTMAGPPTKKRRTVAAEDPPPASARASKAPSTRRAASSSVAAKSKALPSKPPTKAKKLTGKYKSLHTFFGIPQGGSFPVLSSSQHEDADDQIEEVSDDEDEDGDVLPPGRRKRSAPTTTTATATTAGDGTLTSHLVMSKPGVTAVSAAASKGKDLKRLLAVKASRTATGYGLTMATATNGAMETTAATNNTGMPAKKPRGRGAAASAMIVSSQLTRSSDMRTWAEKYAPKTVEELALNKMKVKEVRTWLEGVLGGTSRQRVLVLKGSAGTGKTATLTALAKEMDLEILEWRNPSSPAGGEEYGEEGAFSAGLNGLFEEFVGRAGTFGSLELVPSTGKTQSTTPLTDGGKRKVIVIEDFPNTLFTSSSAPLQSFRHTIKSFLALPHPPLGAPPLPPLALIITETASISGPNSFTAHRLLSPEILHHPLVREIAFNKIAQSYMYKALTAIIAQESRQSGRKFGPSKPVLDALSTSGDIRSAVMGLEFLAMNGDLPGKGFTERIVHTKKRGRVEDRDLNEDERKMVEAVTQRESSYGIFHAVGKVVYNKRYGDDPEDPYVPIQLRPPLPTLPYHPRAVRVDLETLIDDTGTDPQTFISGLHENYLGSCNPGRRQRLPTTSDEDVLDTIINCLDYLSDSDLLGSKGFGYGFNSSADTLDIRVDEISFQTAVRGVMLSLPSPVRRFLEPKGGAQKMYYPTAARLWRDKLEVGEVVEWYVGKERATGACKGGKKEALEERMPFLGLIERRREWSRRYGGGGSVRPRLDTLDLSTKKALERVTVFKGISRQSDDPVDDDDAEEEPVIHTRGRWESNKEKNVSWAEDLGGGRVGEQIEKLVLSDDDIEDF